MSKLFVIGIGGTGSRVIKALTMLMASGVDMPNTSEVVPMIIDPDKSNGDLNRTVEILKKYQSIRSKLGSFDHNHFFKTKITTLNQLSARKNDAEKNVSPEFKLNLKGIDGERFKDFIDLTNLDEANQAMVRALFSPQNLDSDMEVGFKGNPNIGSVVLNQFKDSEELVSFASNFAQNDRIFIISSIFGGTGAAGFPLLLKNIRNADKDQLLQNATFLTNARIGAVSILPYFGVEPDEESEIDKSTFFSKTKAALNYYIHNIIDNKSINSMYFLGDDVTKDYANNEGSLEQKNDAHFIELAAALSIIDFTSIGDEFLTCDNGRAVEDVYIKEYGLKEGADIINFSSLSNISNAKIKKPLIQYKYFTYFLEQQISESIKTQPWANKGDVKIDETFLHTNLFYSDFLKTFNQHFTDWLKEMDRNKRNFSPFKEVTSDSVFHMVNGFPPKKGLNFVRNIAFYEGQLNKAEKKLGDLPVEEKFMSLFYKATENIVKEKFNIS